MKSVLATIAFAAGASAYVTGVNPYKPPHQSEGGQYGYNDCGTKDDPNSKCQTLYINSATDFCIFSAPYTANVGDIERIAVAYCAQPGHGARLIPSGTFKNLHYVSTPHYVQITAEGDFTKLKIKPGDEGGELDPHGYDGKGNPIGGLVFGGFASGKPEQFADWTEFISDSELCIRACHNGPDAGRYCQHIYDVMGCQWNMPGNYGGGFDSCKGDDVPHPMGEYAVNGGISTWYQGVNPTPGPGAPGKTSQCGAVASPTGAAYGAGVATTPVATPTTTKKGGKPKTTKKPTKKTTKKGGKKSTKKVKKSTKKHPKGKKTKRDVIATQVPSEKRGNGIGYSSGGRFAKEA